MDIKAPLYRYDEACGNRVDIEKIKESVRLIKRMLQIMSLGQQCLRTSLGRIQT